MKSVISLLLTISSGLFSQFSYADSLETIAPFAIVIDVGGGASLFEKNPDLLIDPGAMTQLMTTQLVLHEITERALNPDDEFTITEGAWRKGGAPAHTSTMFALLNSKVKVIDLLRAAMIVSANDACIALAEGIAGSEAAFAKRMTERAHELKLLNSRFANATGQHPGAE
jgi:serine-type D-Ala-D-Ala carboxypeptidase (penicillin-binding protein 5/6)